MALMKPRKSRTPKTDFEKSRAAPPDPAPPSKLKSATLKGVYADLSFAGSAGSPAGSFCFAGCGLLGRPLQVKCSFTSSMCRPFRPLLFLSLFPLSSVLPPFPFSPFTSFSLAALARLQRSVRPRARLGLKPTCHTVRLGFKPRSPNRKCHP